MSCLVVYKRLNFELCLIMLSPYVNRLLSYNDISGCESDIRYIHSDGCPKLLIIVSLHIQSR